MVNEDGEVEARKKPGAALCGNLFVISLIGSVPYFFLAWQA